MLVLVSVAFFTLFERKILGYSHNRFGPNKIIFYGVFQPFSDALKLFLKLDWKRKEVNVFYWSIAPILGIFLSILMWAFTPFWGLLYSFRFSYLFFILLRGLSVYFLLYRGWATTTKFSLLGSYRSSAQSVSYEVIMIVVFLVVVYWWAFLNLIFIYSFSFLIGLFLLGLPLFICWLLSCVAECNRSPFDFSEGESELVSGFNTEYGGGFFSLIFIAEYSSILLLSILSSFIFFSFLVFLFFCFLSFIYLWVRTSFPRLRYDLLMVMAWKGLIIYLLGFFFTSFFLFS